MTRRRRTDDAQAFADALAGRRPATQEAASLLRVTEQLRAHTRLEPSEQFRAELRATLMTEAATALVATPATPTRPPVSVPARHPVRRRIAAVATATVASLGVVGLVTSSAAAVPGDTLYSVKRGVENVQLSLQEEGAERGAYQLERASERLEELQTVVQRGGAGDAARAATLLDAFIRQAESGSLDLFDAYATSGTPRDIATVNDFATVAARDLGALSTQVPARAESSFDDAAASVEALAVEAARLCGTCAEADVSSLARLVAAAAADPVPGDPKAPEAPKRSETAEPRVAAAPPAVAPAAQSSSGTPGTPQPAPTAPRPTLVSGVVDPVVTALLGDEDTTGLVPALLGGLLGGNKS